MITISDGEKIVNSIRRIIKTRFCLQIQKPNSHEFSLQSLGNMQIQCPLFIGYGHGNKQGELEGGKILFSH